MGPFPRSAHAAGLVEEEDDKEETGKEGARGCLTEELVQRACLIDVSFAVSFPTEREQQEEPR